MSAGTGAVRSAPGVQGGPPESHEVGSGPHGPRPAAPVREVHDVGRLSIEFGDQAAAAKFVLALVSLLSGVADEVVAVDATGQLRDDLDLDKLKRRIEEKGSLLFAPNYCLETLRRRQ